MQLQGEHAKTDDNSVPFSLKASPTRRVDDGYGEYQNPKIRASVVLSLTGILKGIGNAPAVFLRARKMRSEGYDVLPPFHEHASIQEIAES